MFGSVARDQASANSDVDLLVEHPDRTSLFDHAELKTSLKELLLTRMCMSSTSSQAIEGQNEWERRRSQGKERQKNS